LAAAQEIALPSGLDPVEVAAEYAQSNGATLQSCQCDAGTSQAVVEVVARVTLIFVGPDRLVRARARAVIGDQAGASLSEEATKNHGAGTMAGDAWDAWKPARQPVRKRENQATTLHGSRGLHTGQAGADPGLPHRAPVAPRDMRRAPRAPP